MSRRLRAINPGWTHRIWDDSENRELLAQYFPQHIVAYDSIPFGVAKADIARYIYMHAYGGFYVDTDYKVFRPFEELRGLPCVIPLEGAKPQERRDYLTYLGVGNAVFGSEVGHPFWHKLVTHIFEHNRPERMRTREDVLRFTGPRAVNIFFLENVDEFTDIVMPERHLFYPSMRWAGMRTSATAATFGVHLHWGSWRHRSLTVAARVLTRRKLNALLG